jgi:hypothetical protein
MLWASYSRLRGLGLRDSRLYLICASYITYTLISPSSAARVYWVICSIDLVHKITKRIFGQRDPTDGGK